MKYATRHVCTLFNISPETARTWADEFERHLSPLANPGDGRHRQFSEDDMRVFSLVSSMKADGLTFADIHNSLDAGQRGLAPILDASEVQALVVTERENQLLAQVQKLREYVENVERERDNLLPLRDENIELKALLKRSDEQLTDAQKQIRALYEEIGLLKAKGNTDKSSE
jgi:DNA-binding transcriptional MerR regulator